MTKARFAETDVARRERWWTSSQVVCNQVSAMLVGGDDGAIGSGGYSATRQGRKLTLAACSWAVHPWMPCRYGVFRPIQSSLFAAVIILQVSGFSMTSLPAMPTTSQAPRPRRRRTTEILDVRLNLATFGIRSRWVFRCS